MSDAPRAISWTEFGIKVGSLVAAIVAGIFAIALFVHTTNSGREANKAATEANHKEIIELQHWQAQQEKENVRRDAQIESLLRESGRKK